MPRERSPRTRFDRVILLEVVLGLVLFGLAVVLYWIPASREPFLPRWWSLPLLAALFFGLVALDTWRRRRQRTAELREVVQEVTRDAAEQVPERRSGPREDEPL